MVEGHTQTHSYFSWNLQGEYCLWHHGTFLERSLVRSTSSRLASSCILPLLERRHLCQRFLGDHVVGRNVSPTSVSLGTCRGQRHANNRSRNTTFHDCHRRVALCLGQNNIQINGLLPLLLHRNSTSPSVLLDLEIKVHDEIKGLCLVAFP